MKQPSTSNFVEKALKHWTKDRIEKLTAGHKYQILPNLAPGLLRTLGILNQDGTMSADATRKFIQVNHLLALFKPHFEDLNTRHKEVKILDAGCGSSVLTFTLAWAYQNLWNHPTKILGIDSNAKLIDKSLANAQHVDFADTIEFKCSSISEFIWTDHPLGSDSRPHAVVALHACDTATDDAIALGIREKSDFIAVAPCCQAELAKKWKTLADQTKNHALKPVFHNPHLRRELGANFTDLMRVLILRGHGYEVTTTEFTMSHATPKNTLILATRRGRYHKESQQEFHALAEWCGGTSISLIEKVPFETAKLPE